MYSDSRIVAFEANLGSLRSPFFWCVARCKSPNKPQNKASKTADRRLARFFTNFDRKICKNEGTEGNY